jgi:AcrR family transcriptional regulator
MSATAARGRKDTQRERLLAGMITAANRDGYARASVTAVIAEAGVSRPTFYDYFSDRAACFAAALTDVHERLLAATREELNRHPPHDALTASIRALLAFAAADPARARFLTNEPIAAGRGALDARDAGIAALSALVEHAQRTADPGASIPDIPAHIAHGAVQRLLAPRLRRGEPGLSEVLADLLDWLARYAQPRARLRRQTLRPGPTPPLTPFLIEAPLRAPQALTPGRPRLSEEQVAENHRQRILYAVARLAETQGYAASTVRDITRLARIDGRAFYALFADKQNAFMAVHEVGFQQVMSVTAGAFFAGSTWPERSWEAARALTQFLEANPLIAHVGFVEAHAVGPRAVQRVEDSHIAFTIFLQEGYQHTRRSDPPSRLALEATVTAIFELIYHQARRGGPPQLTGLVGHIGFLLLAPFLGAGDAETFIDAQLTASVSAATRPSARSGASRNLS